MNEIPEKLRSLAGRLSEWRASRKRGTRIPEELWSEAVNNDSYRYRQETRW